MPEKTRGSKGLTNDALHKEIEFLGGQELGKGSVGNMKVLLFLGSPLVRALVLQEIMKLIQLSRGRIHKRVRGLTWRK